MSAEPLTREEREKMVDAAQIMALMTGNNPYHDLGLAIETYEATVQAVEAERDALARRVEALRAAMEEALREVGELSNGDLREKIRESLAADDAARGDQ